jgi:hypothetical protein
MSEIKYLACEKCGVFPDAPTATRLRRVCNALNLQNAVPDDDLQLYRSMFSVLGMIARKIETKPDTITLSITEHEALKLQAAIGKLVLEKFVSGNSVPVSRCYINASELEAIAKDSP